MKSLAISAIIAVALSGCVKQPNGPTTQHGNFQVSTLFTQDGCTVYRFYDGGNMHYFANCPAGAVTMQDVSCGKNCTRDEVISTGYEG